MEVAATVEVTGEAVMAAAMGAGATAVATVGVEKVVAMGAGATVVGSEEEAKAAVTVEVVREEVREEGAMEAG